MVKAVFIDRDGVIVIPEMRNGRSYAPRSIETFSFYPEAKNSLMDLRDNGFLSIVITNQPDVGAGLVADAILQKMHFKLLAELAIDDIEVCIDTRENAGSRRKPQPGMILDAATKWDIDLSQSFMVGDRSIDIDAGRTAGCRTVFIDRHYAHEPPPITQDATFTSIADAVKWILENSLK